ncbi:4Fe-4S binding protein [Berryella wangjianweii]|uniref:4Fe-4S binding protein n=1 Tax=Berryella wangjianweii TaxID=2734634 RepID=UPI0021BD9283|nr:4Fe-4S binding protein [Berryella wangjianweii]
MAIFELGAMTLRSIFGKPETVLYPLEEKPAPMGLRGHIENDPSRCVLCSACARACTTGCLTVDKKGRTWEIQPYACVQCGLCVEVCPKDALSMETARTAVGAQKPSRVVLVPERERPVRKPRPQEAAEHVSEASSVEVAGKTRASEGAALPASEGAQLSAELLALIAAKTAGLDPARAEKVRAGLIARASRADGKAAPSTARETSGGSAPDGEEPAEDAPVA